MHTQEQMDGIVEKWKQCTAREKAETIAVFLKECGENIKWEDWITFLHLQYRYEGFNEHLADQDARIVDILHDEIIVEAKEEIATNVDATV